MSDAHKTLRTTHFTTKKNSKQTKSLINKSIDSTMEATVNNSIISQADGPIKLGQLAHM